MMRSVFAASYEMPRFKRLDADTKADVLVIGGGIAGILTAYFLKKEGADVLLLEEDRLCGGQTGNTTAKITVEHGFLYADVMRRNGSETACAVWQANTEALQKYRELAENIDCDFKTKDFFAYARRGRYDALAREISALLAIGAPIRYEKKVDLPFEIAGALRVKEQADFHPTRFLSGLLDGIRIHENTPVMALFDGGAKTADGKIVRAERVVLATHFPFPRFRGAFALKMYQSRSYVLSLSSAPLPTAMYADGEGEGASLRAFGDLLLMGGAGHRTGVSGGGFNELSHLASSYYPGAVIRGRWAAQDCITLDGLPYIGRMTQGNERVLVATGFGKWGMTSAMLAATLLTDLLMGRPNPYTEIFSPSRAMAGLPLLKNIGATLKHYLRPTAPRCPHLGCALRWNAQERSWDCPCHGSRFDEDGALLDAPATHGIKRKK